MVTNKNIGKARAPHSGNMAEWRDNALEPVLARYPERRDEFTTTSDVDIERLYTPENTAIDYPVDLGYPGEPPYTRGIQPTMYRGKFWTMRQYAGFGTEEET